MTGSIPDKLKASIDSATSRTPDLHRRAERLLWTATCLGVALSCLLIALALGWTAPPSGLRSIAPIEGTPGRC